MVFWKKSAGKAYKVKKLCCTLLPSDQKRGRAVSYTHLDVYKRQGFKVGDVSPGESERDEGEVYEQSPEAGESAPEGSTVDLRISDGSLQKVKMPYVIGMDIDDAKAALYEAGLKPGKISYKTSDDYDVNEVMSQQYDCLLYTSRCV